MCKILTVNPINSVFICDIFIAIIMYNALNVLYVNLSLSTNFFILRRRSFQGVFYQINRKGKFEFPYTITDMNLRVTLVFGLSLLVESFGKSDKGIKSPNEILLGLPPRIPFSMFNLSSYKRHFVLSHFQIRLFNGVILLIRIATMLVLTFILLLDSITLQLS